MVVHRKQKRLKPEEYLAMERASETRSEFLGGEVYAMGGASKQHNTYPDIAVVCDGARFEDAEMDTLLNPQVIIEVLSKSTAAYDRGEKFEHYRKIPSLVEYLLIAQEKCLVEHYIRQPDGRWLLSEFNSLQDVVELPSIGCKLALADVYEDVLVIVDQNTSTD